MELLVGDLVGEGTWEDVVPRIGIGLKIKGGDERDRLRGDLELDDLGDLEGGGDRERERECERERERECERDLGKSLEGSSLGGGVCERATRRDDAF